MNDALKGMGQAKKASGDRTLLKPEPFSPPRLSKRVVEYLCLRNAVNWGSVVLAAEWSLRVFGIKINAL